MMTRCQKHLWRYAHPIYCCFKLIYTSIYGIEWVQCLGHHIIIDIKLLYICGLFLSPILLIYIIHLCANQ